MSLIITIFGFGLLILFSASSFYSLNEYGNENYLFFKQLIFAGAGIIVLLIASCINYKIYYNLAKIFYYASLGLCFATLIFARAKRGSSRWINFHGISIQPSEILKVAVIIFLSVYLVKNYKKIEEKKVLQKFLLIGLAPAVLIALNNLSTAIIIVFITFFMYFFVSKKYKIFFIGIGVMILIYIFAYPLARVLEKFSILKAYQLERIFVWKNPAEYKDKAFQTMQGLYAIGRGGLFGKGLGESLQKMILPEAQNDMIFAIICEELGLFGASFLILLYTSVIYRLYSISLKAKDLFGTFLSFGIMVHIALQVILNIAVVCNLIPNTGITLPFVSYGGSSTLVLCSEIGIALSVSRFSNDET